MFKSKEKIYISALFLIFLVNFFVFFMHFNVVLLDFGREFLIPKEMLSGKLLYKDILCIYPPLGFYINALIFKIFGASLHSLYFAGTICSGIFLWLFYSVCREFFDYKISVPLTYTIMMYCVFNGQIFAFTNPYSYSILYGFLACMGIALLQIKFYKNNNIKYSYISSFLAGTALICKFEFYAVPLALVLTYIFLKKMSVKEIFKNFLCFLTIPVLMIFIMIMQGITPEILWSALLFIKKIAFTEPMVFFHKYYVGLYPSVNILQHSLITTLIFVLQTAIFYLLYKIETTKNETFAITLAYATWILYTYNDFLRYALFPLILILLVIIYGKKLYNDNKAQLMLAILAIACAAKSIWFTLIYWQVGNVSLPLIFIALLCIYKAIYSENFEKNKIFISVLILSTGLSMNIINWQQRYNILTCKVKNKFEFYTNKFAGQDLQPTINWLVNNTDKNDTVLVYPEGEIINIMADRPTDLKLYSLNSMFVDTLGTEYIINRIKHTRIPYIVTISGCNIFEYGNDNYYPQINKFIQNNYDLVNISYSQNTGGKYNFIYIYKRK